ncbi:MAG: ABC transporter permease [Phycisphaeraceae bacterium]|nr:ABC transporter permease [Phycisphaeraceae bacterium]
MWTYVLRRLLYAIPVYLGIIFIVMAALRINDPVAAYLGKNATAETVELKRRSMGLDRPFLVQYADFLRRIATLDFGSADRPYRSWQYESDDVGKKLAGAIGPTVAVTVPTLVLTSLIAITVGMISAFYRGRWPDRLLMFFVVLGMSISVVVFIVVGQSLFRGWINALAGSEVLASNGYEPGPGNWVTYCALPVLIGVVVGMGYDARFYRAVFVEETGRDYVTTARAKGAGRARIMFVHMLKNAMIPVITRIMITVPFLVTGSIVMEYQFRIPGMGKLLIDALGNKDFPIIQAFTAVFALLFIVTNILTDVLYALVDPRVRLA